MESVLEKKLMTSYKDEMISFLNSQPEYFEEAIKLAITDNQPYAWRSAFILWSSMEKNDKRIQKYAKSIVDNIKTKKDGHQRELLKILYKMELKDKHEGQIFDICMNLWEQNSKTPSVRMTAFKSIIKISKKHSELLEQIDLLLQDQYIESLSPGVKRSINKMMNELIE